MTTGAHRSQKKTRQPCGQREVQIAARPVSTPARKEKEKVEESVAALDAESAGLFQHLRRLRKQLADERGVAPYVVFPDASLRAMAQL